MHHCKNNTDWLILKKHRQMIMTLFTDHKRRWKYAGLNYVTANDGEHSFVLRFWVEHNLYIEIYVYSASERKWQFQNELLIISLPITGTIKQNDFFLDQ